MRAKRSGGAKATCRLLNSFVGESGPQIADLLCIRASNALAATIIWKNIMKNKNSKKLSLAKETLKTLSAGDLARVQGGAYALLDTVLALPDLFGISTNTL